MKVYIYKNKEIETDWIFAACKGFRELQAEIIFFTNVNDIPYAPDNIVVADVEPTIEYMDKHNIKYPRPLNIPACLREDDYLQRKVKTLTLKQVAAITTPVFIKPFEKVKQFSSGVIKHGSNIHYLIDQPDATAVFVSNIIDIVSEWRGFVYNKELVGLKHYSGQFDKFPDIAIIDKMIYRYKGFAYCPIAYTIDVAVISTPNPQKTVLIECNDFWSIGHYGLDPLTYAKMLRDRWFQMTEYRKWT